MDNFLELYRSVEKCHDKLANLESDYIGKFKGTIYQQRRDKYRKSLNFYLNKCRELVTKHKVTRYFGKLGDDEFSILVVDMDMDSIKFFLELTTGKKVYDLKSAEWITGNLEILK